MKTQNMQGASNKLKEGQLKVARKGFKKELARMRAQIKSMGLSGEVIDAAKECCFLGCNYFKFDGSDHARIEKAVKNELSNIKHELKDMKIPKKFIDGILEYKAKKLKKREIERRAFYQEAITLSKR